MYGGVRLGRYYKQAFDGGKWENDGGRSEASLDGREASGPSSNLVDGRRDCLHCSR
jgi:hypothetical protein